MDASIQEPTDEQALGSHILDKNDIIADYRLAYRSRQVSLTGRKEVLGGKAKFGIFGDGKEVPQLAMSKVFRKGDFRSGYYRDQTWAMATGVQNVRQFFAQLYADTDPAHETSSAGRQMNAHFASRSLNEDGSWRSLVDQYNSYADVSPTASQMQRMVGLVQASILYRKLESLNGYTQFSDHGNEVIFGTIGNASCAEGHFWETINAIGVIGGPLVMSVWDDGYGISVPNKFQIAKNSISEVLSGFQRKGEERGYEIFKVNGWDYVALCETYAKAAMLARVQHIPCLVHVVEVTQPQGHSTSGSHERYKNPERMQFEKDYDCITKMREWMLAEDVVEEEQLLAWEKEDRKYVRTEKNTAWQEFQTPIFSEISMLTEVIEAVAVQSQHSEAVIFISQKLKKISEPFRANAMETAHEVLRICYGEKSDALTRLQDWQQQKVAENKQRFSSHLYSEHADSAMNVAEIPAVYSENPEELPGFQILNKCFDAIFARDPRVVAFGEDVGQLGDVNQGLAGMQEKYGKRRVFDTGIREATIAGQAIGLAARGLRPIAEVQYLDYFLYALQTLSDDLATLRYRTAGYQKAPAIIRTRGHRLEGIWHSGSPMGMIINALRGMYVLVPRNMVQAAGFYNTMMQAEEPALIVEVLNGYRLREQLPENLSEFRIAPGIPEVIRQGEDVSIVTYGACCQIAMKAAEQLEKIDLDVEIIDVRSLLPFDVNHSILDSLKKTNRIIFFDEDVPGGASAYMMQQVLEDQGGYYHLDAKPVTLCAKAHRAAFGTDGDYFSKPQVADLYDAVIKITGE